MVLQVHVIRRHAKYINQVTEEGLQKSIVFCGTRRKDILQEM
jgi:hypothetical protein